MRACPQPIIAAVEGVCAGAGRDPRDGQRHPLRGAGREDRLPVHPRRPVSGADMGACAILPRIIGHGRAAELLFTGRNMSAEEGLAWGFWNRLRRRRAGRSAGARARARERPDARPRGDQAPARRRMARVDRSRARHGGRGPGRVHADQRFQARLRGVRGASTSRSSRATDDSTRLPRLAVLRASAIASWRSELEDWCAATIYAGRYADDLDGECRALVRELGAAGFLKLCVADGEHRPDVRSLAIARETLAYHRGLADFAFAMQGLGSGAISLFGTIEQKREWLPQGRGGRGDRRLRHDRARMRIGRRQHVDLGDARRQRMGAGRREDATSPTAGSPIST